MYLKICLAEEGNCFEVSHNDKTLTQDESKAIHPVIEQIVSAKTHKEVVEALQALRLVAKNLGNNNDYWKSYQYVIKSNIDIHISCLHVNCSSYSGHAAFPGKLHSDSIEGMIAFADGSDRNQTCTIF